MIINHLLNENSVIIAIFFLGKTRGKLRKLKTILIKIYKIVLKLVFNHKENRIGY